MKHCLFFFLRTRRPPRSTRTDTLFPYTTLFRSGANNEVVYSVPRIEFATRSGVWAEEPQLEAITAKRTAVWDVVLIKPVLIPEPRRWRFAREGLEFSALMQDASVLQAIHDKTLPMQLAEGVMMKVEMNYRESRSEERRVGKECDRTCNTRWSPNH